MPNLDVDNNPPDSGTPAIGGLSGGWQVDPTNGGWKWVDPGGGGGGGGLPLPGAGTSAAGGTAAAGGSTVGATAAGFGGASYADWANFLVGLYNSQKKGSFKQVPMSPQQQQIFDWSFWNLKNTPNNSAALTGLAKNYLGNPSTLDVGALKAGGVGYHSGHTGSAADLAKILNPQPATTNNSVPGAGGAGGTVDNPVPAIGGGYGYGNTNDPYGGDPGAFNIGGSGAPNKDYQRLPNMAATPNGGPAALLSTPQPFDPNMQGRDPNVNPNIKQTPAGSPGNDGSSNNGLNPTSPQSIPAQVMSVITNWIAQNPNWVNNIVAAIGTLSKMTGFAPGAIGATLYGLAQKRGAAQPPPATPPAGGNESAQRAAGLKNIIQRPQPIRRQNLSLDPRSF